MKKLLFITILVQLYFFMQIVSSHKLFAQTPNCYPKDVSPKPFCDTNGNVSKKVSGATNILRSTVLIESCGSGTRCQENPYNNTCIGCYKNPPTCEQRYGKGTGQNASNTCLQASDCQKLNGIQYPTTGTDCNAGNTGKNDRSTFTCCQINGNVCEENTLSNAVSCQAKYAKKGKFNRVICMGKNECNQTNGVALSNDGTYCNNGKSSGQATCCGFAKASAIAYSGSQLGCSAEVFLSRNKWCLAVGGTYSDGSPQAVLDPATCNFCNCVDQQGQVKGTISPQDNSNNSSSNNSNNNTSAPSSSSPNSLPQDPQGYFQALRFTTDAFKRIPRSSIKSITGNLKRIYTNFYHPDKHSENKPEYNNRLGQINAAFDDLNNWINNVEQDDNELQAAILKIYLESSAFAVRVKEEGDNPEDDVSPLLDSLQTALYQIYDSTIPGVNTASYNQKRQKIAEAISFFKDKDNRNAYSNIAAGASCNVNQNPQPPSENNSNTKGIISSYGAVFIKGRSNEDTYDIQVPDSDQGFFSVYDGHSGAETSIYLRDNLYRIIQSYIQRKSPPLQAMIQGYETASNVVKNEGYMDGSTAVTAIIQGKQLFIANAGDSHAVLGRNNTVHRLTVEHDGNNPYEVKRIKQLPGCSFSGDRLKSDNARGSIAVSRSIGDIDFEPCLIATPDVYSMNLTPQDSVIVLTSDGVLGNKNFNISDQQAVSLASKYANAQDAADAIAQAAYNKWSSIYGDEGQGGGVKDRDDITVVVVKLKVP